MLGMVDNTVSIKVLLASDRLVLLHRAQNAKMLNVQKDASIRAP
jgi:hypothetical protein